MEGATHDQALAAARAAWERAPPADIGAEVHEFRTCLASVPFDAATEATVIALVAKRFLEKAIEARPALAAVPALRRLAPAAAGITWFLTRVRPGADGYNVCYLCALASDMPVGNDMRHAYEQLRPGAKVVQVATALAESARESGKPVTYAQRARTLMGALVEETTVRRMPEGQRVAAEAGRVDARAGTAQAPTLWTAHPIEAAPARLRGRTGDEDNVSRDYERELSGMLSTDELDASLTVTRADSAASTISEPVPASPSGMSASGAAATAAQRGKAAPKTEWKLVTPDIAKIMGLPSSSQNGARARGSLRSSQQSQQSPSPYPQYEDVPSYELRRRRREQLLAAGGEHRRGTAYAAP